MGTPMDEQGQTSGRIPDADAATESAGAPEGQAPKRVFVKTFGCQMNVYDSERMIEALGADGYVPAETAEEADVVLLNTCHIRENASEKVFHELGRLRPLSEEKALKGCKLTIGVAGCVAQAEGEEIRRRQPLVDLVVGPQSYHRLPAMVRAASGGAPQIDTEFPVETKFDHLPDRRVAASKRRSRTSSAFLTIQEGCDKFCAFCVVPFTRGSESSRPVSRVLQEARELAESGVREISLLGQNVNAYHGDAPDGSGEWGLGRLLAAVAEIDGVERLRYTTSHPNDMDDALIAAHRDIPAVMPYLHLPVQAGSDRVLKAMNRKHRAADFERVVDRLREARPDIALSSDFIVGFPGETDAEFQETIALVERVGFAQAYSFKYSPRPGTPAAEAEDLPDSVKLERLHELQALLTRQQRAFQDSLVGRRLSVLLEKPGRNPGQLVGKSPYLQAVFVSAPETMLGSVVDVDIVEAATNSLGGQLVS